MGCLLASWIWSVFNPRHQLPATGLYHGNVTADFTSVTLDEPPYSLNFSGRSLSRWYWTRPTNFSYAKLDITWYEWGSSTNRHATVSLPAFTYQMSGTNGVFTPQVLADWLYGPAYHLSGRPRADRIFAYFEAAANGSLPPPRHHKYSSDGPVPIHLYHSLLGFGVCSPVYLWVTVWLFGVVFYGRQVLKGR